MLATPLSRLNISCSCTECNTFLRPLPKNPPPVHLLSTLGLDSHLPQRPAATPTPMRECTPHTTPHLRPIASTLAPSPAFLLTRFGCQNSRKEGAGRPLALPSLSLSPTTSKRVNFASRSLWAHLSSPIDEMKMSLGVKTPGLVTCAQEQCLEQVVPGFGCTVCSTCEDELHRAVLALAKLPSGEPILNRERAKLSRADSEIVLLGAPEIVGQQATKGEEANAEPELFAVPSTPLSTKLLRSHSRTQSLKSIPQQSTDGAHTLFALPNTSLDKSFEEFTPTTPTEKYTMDFPVLPIGSTPKHSKAASVRSSKRSGRGVEGLARSLSKDGGRNERKSRGHGGSKRTSRAA